jgi:hypothetical protein
MFYDLRAALGRRPAHQRAHYVDLALALPETHHRDVVGLGVGVHRVPEPLPGTPIGKSNKGSRTSDQPNTHPATTRTYRLRSFVICELCGRRLYGKTRRIASGYSYYACEAIPAHHASKDWFDTHPKSLWVREDKLLDLVRSLLDPPHLRPGPRRRGGRSFPLQECPRAGLPERNDSCRCRSGSRARARHAGHGRECISHVRRGPGARVRSDVSTILSMTLARRVLLGEVGQGGPVIVVVRPGDRGATTRLA